MREKVGNSQFTVCFQWFGGSKRNLAKAAGAEPAGQMRDEMNKKHAVVARSTFPSQNVQSTPTSDHFWTLSCRKSARRCGGEAHLYVKKWKTPHDRTTLRSWDVEKVHTVLARSTFACHYTADLQPEIQETQRTTHTWATTHCRTQRRNRFALESSAAAPAAHTRYLWSPAAATLHGKKHFVPLLSRQHKPHMQHSCSHYNAICNITWLTCISLRTWQQNTATIMQPCYMPLHRDLQPEIQEMQRTTHTWATTRCRTQRRNRFALESSAAAPAAHTRYLWSPAAATLHGKKHFVPLLSRQHKPHATFMPPLHCNLQTKTQQTHRFTHTTLPIVMWCEVTHHPALSIVSHF